MIFLRRGHHNVAMIEATTVRALLEEACPQLRSIFAAEDDPGHERLMYVEIGAAAR